MMYPDDLRIAHDFIEWLNENHLQDSGELWKYSTRIQIENPEHGQPIGWAVWHSDGFWWFEPMAEKK